MKTYLSVGIGDMILLDSLLTPEEKSNITEIYWACRFGKCIVPLLENNPEYPNLQLSHFIHDEIGKKAMAFLDPIAIPFWHFRPDFPRSFQVGLRLFNIENEYRNKQIQCFPVIQMFYESNRNYVGSSFIKNAKPTRYGEPILFHYPTATRPRSDIATISREDWAFIEHLSQKTGLKVIVISDSYFDVPLTRFELLVNPDMRFIADLCATCSYFVGCDSFCAHLATKRLPKERLFIKSHETNIKQKLLTTSFSRCFLPHSPKDIACFYKSYFGY